MQIRCAQLRDLVHSLLSRPEDAGTCDADTLADLYLAGSSDGGGGVVIYFRICDQLFPTEFLRLPAIKSGLF